jgi:hypothetical protein
MSRPLAGLSFSLSGFVNPERGDLRQAGTDLGAKYNPEWTPTTTHLICAIAGTPKAVQVGYCIIHRSQTWWLTYFLVVAGSTSESSHTHCRKAVVIGLLGQWKKRERGDFFFGQ